jgi:NAD(P)-dependent dehydrogenase (short-subunit alcohol dehydrogenase family)
MRESLPGKVALVTGAGVGIGRASALAFAREGARVVVADVDAGSGEQTAQIIKDSGGEAIFIKADVSWADEVEAMVKKVIAACGRLDCAHNNAGISGVGTLTADCTEENWDRTININLKGVWLCMKYEILQMLKQGSGAIVNTASIHGLGGTRNRPAYVASKHGVVGLTRAAALEYADAGIRINAVCPAWIRTPMLEGVFAANEGTETAFLARLPIGRLGTSEDIAEAAVWLCSDAAAFITGIAMPVDGAYTAQ